MSTQGSIMSITSLASEGRMPSFRCMSTSRSSHEVSAHASGQLRQDL